MVALEKIKNKQKRKLRLVKPTRVKYDATKGPCIECRLFSAKIPTDSTYQFVWEVPRWPMCIYI